MSWFRKTKEPTIEEKLLEAEAMLAYAQELPTSDYTVYDMFGLRYGVDEKPIQIARIKARIAELKVLAKKPKNEGSK